MLDQAAKNLLFLEARTHKAWQDREVPEAVLRELWDLTKMGPTANNSLPLRILFLTGDEAKARLKPLLSEGNVEKTMSAPVTAILAQDMKFYEQLPMLSPHSDSSGWASAPDKIVEEAAFRNSSLQAGYFILAARGLGLDCGPMSGFNKAKVDAEFFPGGTIRSNLLCNLGYGEPGVLHPRAPRLDFAQACEIL